MSVERSSTLRCAVYTRKSSEEGLEQAFNSLDAQREAGLDFIRSQKHQGWVAITEHYDDGGFSGGNTERPGLKRLLTEIENGRVDVVVVYKVDRLSRSLADFARLMQLFDEHKVSFVSVTQQFNTTTSMGRLTLNMLLSFAQFEREVSGERVRDKIAATKKRGVWICGKPPLGYRLPRPDEERILRIVEPEAAIVRKIFAEYLKRGSPITVAAKLNSAGHTTGRFLGPDGKRQGGRAFDNTFIYRVLTNPVYIGKITHTRRAVANGSPPGKRAKAGEEGVVTEVYDGLHQPIITREVWDRVQVRMTKAQRTTRHRWTHTHLLKGKLRTFDGHTMSPSSVSKPLRRNGVDTGERRHTLYYVSQKAIKFGYRTCTIKNLPARPLDDLVRSLVLDYLYKSHDLNLAAHDDAIRDHWLRELLQRIVVATDSLTVEIMTSRINTCVEALPEKPTATTPASQCPYTPEVKEGGRVTTLMLRTQIKRLDGRRAVLGPDGHDFLAPSPTDQRPAPRQHLVRAIGLAYAWQRDLMSAGGTVDEAAARAGVSPARFQYVLPLTHLGPTVLRAILRGALDRSMSLKMLVTTGTDMKWDSQADVLRLR